MFNPFTKNDKYQIFWSNMIFNCNIVCRHSPEKTFLKKKKSKRTQQYKIKLFIFKPLSIMSSSQLFLFYLFLTIIHVTISSKKNLLLYVINVFVLQTAQTRRLVFFFSFIIYQMIFIANTINLLIVC